MSFHLYAFLWCRCCYTQLELPLSSYNIHTWDHSQVSIPLQTMLTQCLSPRKENISFVIQRRNSYILIQNLGFPSKFYFHEMLITSALHKWYSPSNAREATGESTSDVELSSKSDKGDNTSLPCCSPLKLTYWHDENH